MTKHGCLIPVPEDSGNCANMAYKIHIYINTF